MGLLFAIISVTLWGTAGTAQSFAQNISPLWIGAFRLLVACILFHLAYIFVKSRSKAPVANSARHSKAYWTSIAIAGLCMGMYNLTFFNGVSMTGVAIGTATTISSAPIWAGLLQAIISRKTPEKLWWLGTACAIIGGTWMVLIQASSWHINYALYTLTNKKLAGMDASAIMITTHTFTIAALIAVVAAIVMAGKPTVLPQSWAVIIYLAFFTTCIAYLLYTIALKYISAPTGVALALLEPIIAFLLAIFIVKEPINMLSFVGLGLIVMGLAIVLRAETQKS